MNARPLYLLVLAAAVTAPLQAQGRFGVVVGGTSSTISQKPETELKTTSRTGFMVGGRMTIPLTGSISFAPEVVYVQKGAKGSIDDDGVTVNVDAKLTGFEVPLLVRFSPNTSGKLKPFVTAGPYLTFSQKCNEIAKADFGNGVETVEIDCSSDATSEDAAVLGSDMGFIVGGGVSSGALSLTVRYDLGLKNIEKNPTNGSESKNRSLMLVFGYSFR